MAVLNAIIGGALSRLGHYGIMYILRKGFEEAGIFPYCPEKPLKSTFGKCCQLIIASFFVGYLSLLPFYTLSFFLELQSEAGFDAIGENMSGSCARLIEHLTQLRDTQRAASRADPNDEGAVGGYLRPGGRSSGPRVAVSICLLRKGQDFAAILYLFINFVSLILRIQLGNNEIRTSTQLFCDMRDNHYRGDEGRAKLAEDYDEEEDEKYVNMFFAPPLFEAVSDDCMRAGSDGEMPPQGEPLLDEDVVHMCAQTKVPGAFVPDRERRFILRPEEQQRYDAGATDLDATREAFDTDSDDADTRTAPDEIPAFPRSRRGRPRKKPNPHAEQCSQMTVEEQQTSRPDEPLLPPSSTIESTIVTVDHPEEGMDYDVCVSGHSASSIAPAEDEGDDVVLVVNVDNEDHVLVVEQTQYVPSYLKLRVC
jgi:hypothetical protein